MQGVSKKPSTEEFQQVANACGGILSDIAAYFSVARKTVYSWCSNDKDLAEALEDSRERFTDLAESNLRKLIAGIPKIIVDEQGDKKFAGWEERPSESSIFFYLKTQGKKRGYIERQELTGADGKDIGGTIEIIDKTGLLG